MPLNSDEWEITPLSKSDFGEEDWEVTPIEPTVPVPSPAIPTTQATTPIPIPKEKRVQVPQAPTALQRIDDEDSWLQILGKSPMAGFGMAATGAMRAIKSASDVLSARDISNSLKWLSEDIEKYWAPKVGDSTAKKYVSGILQSTTNSLAQMLPLGRTLGLASFGVTSFGNKYQQMRDAGASMKESLLGGAIVGASEAGTEILPMKALFAPGKSIVKRMLTAAALEVPGEIVNTIVESAVDKVTIRPDMTREELYQDLVDTVIITVGQSLLTGGLMHPVVKSMEQKKKDDINKGVIPTNLINAVKEVKEEEDDRPLSEIINSELEKATTVAPPVVEPGKVVEAQAPTARAPEPQVDMLKPTGAAPIPVVEPTTVIEPEVVPERTAVQLAEEETGITVENIPGDAVIDLTVTNAATGQQDKIKGDAREAFSLIAEERMDASARLEESQRAYEALPNEETKAELDAAVAYATATEKEYVSIVNQIRGLKPAEVKPTTTQLLAEERQKAVKQIQDESLGITAHLEELSYQELEAEKTRYTDIRERIDVLLQDPTITKTEESILRSRRRLAVDAASDVVHAMNRHELKVLKRPPLELLVETTVLDSGTIKTLQVEDLRSRIKSIQSEILNLERSQRNIIESEAKGEHPLQKKWLETIEKNIATARKSLGLFEAEVKGVEEKVAAAKKRAAEKQVAIVGTETNLAVDNILKGVSPEQKKALIDEYGFDISTEAGRHSYILKNVKKYSEYISVIDEISGAEREDLINPNGKMELANLKPDVLARILKDNGLSLKQVNRIREEVNVIAIHIFKPVGFLANIDTLTDEKLIRDLEINRRILPNEHPIRQLQGRAGVGYFEQLASIIRGHAEANKGVIEEGKADELIKKFGEDNNIIVDKDTLKELNRLTGDYRGAEHTIIFDVGRQSVIKWMYSPVFNNDSRILSYLQRIEYFNQFFPGASLRIIGIVDRGTSVSTMGRYGLLLEQPYVNGRAPTESEMREYMLRRGYVGRSGHYYHAEYGIAVHDAHTGNSKITLEGKLIPFDLLIKDMTDADRRKLPERQREALDYLAKIDKERQKKNEPLPDFIQMTPAEVKEAASDRGNIVGKVQAGMKANSYINRLPVVAAALSNKKFTEWINKSLAEMGDISNAGEMFMRYLENAYKVSRNSKDFASKIRKEVLAGNLPNFTEVSQAVFVTPQVADEIKIPEPVKDIAQDIQEDGQDTIADSVQPYAAEDLDDELPTKNEALKMIKKKVDNMNQALTVVEGVDALAKHYGIPLRRNFNKGMAVKSVVDMAQKIKKLFIDVKAGMLVKDKNNSNNDIKDKILLADKIMDEYYAEPIETIEAIPEKRGKKKKKELDPAEAMAVKGEVALEKILNHVEQETEKITERDIDAELDALEQGLNGILKGIAQRDKEVKAKREKMPAKKKGKRGAELDIEVAIETDLSNRSDMIHEAADVGVNTANREAKEINRARIFRLVPGLALWKGFFQNIAGANARKAKASAREVLEFMANNLPKKSWGQLWSKVLLENTGNKLDDLTIYFANVEGGRGSAYFTNEHRIYINLGKESPVNGISGTVLHEVIHGLTTRALTDPTIKASFEALMEQSKKSLPVQVLKLLAQFKTAKEINRNVGWVSSNGYTASDFKLAYSHSDVREFLAGIMNMSVLREHLKSQVIGEKPEAKTLWQRVVRWFSENVFKTTDYTMLDQVLDKMTSELIDKPQDEIDRIWSAFLPIEDGIHENLRDHWNDIKSIMDSNTDMRGWQKFLPMHILGKSFQPARAIMQAWMEGMRLLNRMLFTYEFDIDPATGKQTVKSFFKLSHPLKPITKAQRLFDKVSVEGDIERRNMTRQDIERINTQFGIHASAEEVNKVEESYRDIRNSYRHAWKWYWDNVRQVGLRVYERRPWFIELQDVMMNRGTQIDTAMRQGVATRYGTEEAAKFERARDSMIKAWNAIQEAESHYVEGYMPRRRLQGKYRVNVKDAQGNLIDVQFAINELQAHRMKYKAIQENPNATVEAFYVAPSPENLFEEFDTKDLQAFISKITGLMEAKAGISEATIDEFYSALEANIAAKFKARGFRQHRIERVGEAGMAISGYQTDNIHEVFLGYIRNMVGSIRKMNFAFDANNIMRNIDISERGELFSYVRQYRDDMLRNEHMADRVISNVRSVAYLYYLAANIKAAAVNATQNIILGIPMYARALKEQGMSLPLAYAKAIKDITKASVDIMRYHTTGNIPADEYNMLQMARVDGDSGAMQLQYMSGAMDRTMGGRYTHIVNFLGLPFSTIETLNREVAMLAFYRLHADLPQGERYRAARENMYDVHFPYGKYNYPELVRASGLLGNIGHLLSTFRSYSIMYVSTIVNSFKGADGKVNWRHADVFFGSLAMLVIMGGLMAPWLDDLLDIYERMSGRPVRENIRKALRDIGGEKLQSAGMHGILSIVGIDITGSLKLGVPFIGSGGIEETLLGAYAGLESKAERGVEAFKIGDYLRSLEEFSPAFVSNLMKAMREYEEGGTTVEGRKITDPAGKHYRPTLPEAVGQALGFRVGRRADISESQRTYMNVKLAMAKERERIYARFRKADTPEERRALLPEVRDFNRRALEFRGGVPPITLQSLRRAIIDKRDKRRYLFDMMFREDDE